MNTRIQVEHPVTEMVTGVDIVKEQFRIAAGKPMSCKEIELNGHAIEVRLYAEDPANNFLPAIGKLAVFKIPSGQDIRLDTGVQEGEEITPDYDPMMAKLIVWAPSREEALEKMAKALDDFIVLGCVTNIRFLRELCNNSDVIDGWTTTDLIDRLWPNGWMPDIPEKVMNAALLLASAAEGTGLAKKSITSAIDGEAPSPFMTISRRFP
jgi:acetyl/propionyl-CoA carboxylase alpha subunit